MNRLRKDKKITKQSMRELQMSDDSYVWLRGDVLLAITNVGNVTGSHIEIAVNLSDFQLSDFRWANQYLVNQLDNFDVIQVTGDNIANIVFRDGRPKVYHPIVRIPNQQQSFASRIYQGYESYIKPLFFSAD